VTDVFGQKAIDFINKDDDKPFFLYLSFTAPHAPMNAKKEDLPLFEHIENKKRRTLAAMIWAMDRAIGKVLKTLEYKGIADNTIIWFLSDNGGAKANSSNNYPLAGNKGIKFEGGHHVPFIMKWKKKFPKPFTYDKPVISLDILPTSVSAAGGKFGEIDGVNLLDKVTDNNVTPHQNLYWHKLWFSAMREGDWKIIYVEDYGYALYNLKADLGEKHNLAKQHPERLASMKKVLNAWKGELTEPLWREASKWKKVHGKEQIDLIEGKNKK
ncbi:MAG: sulfatase-like hydrolase/transferase, partial [Lentisphaeraceae bacterium]|nr:sulfatase-like hydrolase/transferase [Lentisphaeraceae bacterium]